MVEGAQTHGLEPEHKAVRIRRSLKLSRTAILSFLGGSGGMTQPQMTIDLSDITHSRN